MSPSRWLARGALVLLATGVAAACAEYAVRAMWTMPSWHGGSLDPQNSDAACTTSSPTRGWTALPDTCQRDGHGARIQYANGELPDDAPTALLLGDSVAYNGGWVDEAIRASGVRIWNHGMSGYEPCQEADLLRELPQLDEAGHLVLQLADNDLWGSPAAIPYANGLRLHVGEHQAVDIPNWALDSRLALFVLTNWGLKRERRMPRVDQEECIHAVARAARDRGIPMTIVHFPSLTEQPSVDELQLHEIALRADAHLIEVRPLLEGSLPDVRDWRVRDDDHVHPGPRTGAVVGAALGARLRLSDVETN